MYHFINPSGYKFFRYRNILINAALRSHWTLSNSEAGPIKGFGSVSVKPGLWTLDWTMDWTVDSLLDWELDLVTPPKINYSTMVNSLLVIM